MLRRKEKTKTYLYRKLLSGHIVVSYKQKRKMAEHKLAKEVEDVFRYAISENEIYIAGKNNFRVLKNDEVIFSTETEDTFQDVYESLKSCCYVQQRPHQRALNHVA